jgi:hypothetical protein
MVERQEPNRVIWPRWATWALVATALTLVVTIIATLNDIY